MKLFNILFLTILVVVEYLVVLVLWTDDLEDLDHLVVFVDYNTV